jgi:glycerol-3-phosphate dehydrogenase
VYDLLALRWDHNYYSPEDFQLLAPHISLEDLQGGFRFGDAQTDDARLTLRVIREACADGGTAINYVRAVGLVMENGRVNGVCLKDILTDQEAVARAQVVINATGAWADQLRKQVGGPAHIRPLRGSHLIFPAWRLPVAQAVSFMHPLDHRPVFIFPWEGITLVGTTDVDHPDPLEEEPKISPEEVSYLMAAVEYQFPSLGISLQDVISTYSGVRPVIGSGKLNPSEESRDHVIWEENGLITVTGGKLTTFRLIGLDVINAIRELIPGIPERHDGIPVLNPVDVRLPGCDDLNDTCRRRLLGRLGADALPMLRSARADEMEVIAGTNYRWAELRWAARSEGVCHLDDLLLRRTRLGLILPQGAQSILPRLKQICIEELAWSEPRWQEEQKRYLELWLKNYALPHPELIPDWRIAVKNTMRVREIHAQKQRKKMIRSSGLAALSFVMIGMSLAQLWKRSRRSKT